MRTEKQERAHKKYIRWKEKNPEAYEKSKKMAAKWNEENSDKYKKYRTKYLRTDKAKIRHTTKMFSMFGNEASAIRTSIDKKNIDFLYLIETKQLLIMIYRYYIYINSLRNTNKKTNKSKLKEAMEVTIVKQRELSKEAKISSKNTQEVIELLIKAINNYDQGKITRTQFMTYVHAGNTLTKAIFGKYAIDQSIINIE